MSGIELLDFPASDDEAAARYEATKSADPFPDIRPALLNTADMVDYIAATGMIYPFEVDPDRLEKTLKPASCAIPVGGEWLYWPPTTELEDPDGQSGVLEAGQDLWLKPNSIVYVTLAPMFRMPDYIAARYNLRIKHIYRGILVGTGPLVDPGFHGRLSVPLHNLTANPYLIKGGEPLVWMEFTKLSDDNRWARLPAAPATRRGQYVSFAAGKLERQSIRDYVQYAHEGPIRSSIPEQTEQAREAAKGAEKAVEDAEETVEKFRNLSLWVAVGVVIALFTLGWQTLEFINNSKDGERELRQEVGELRAQLSSQREVFRVCASDGEALRPACFRRELR